MGKGAVGFAFSGVGEMMATSTTTRKFTVDEYNRMSQVGILDEDDRVELWDGEIRVMSPIGSAHSAVVNRLIALFSEALGKRVVLSVQNPVELDEYHDPQPDVAVLKPKADYYASGHPQPRDTLLVVEVSDTSLVYDREEKLPKYAEVGIPEVWIVDIQGEAIEQFSQPSGHDYQQRSVLGRGQRLGSVSFPDLILVTDDILG